MTVDREHLNSMVVRGWLRSQRHPDADLWIYNYTEKTQFENYWTPLTLACRGLILNADGEIVARPFRKFFNYGTPQVGELPAEPFKVTEKMDGSLGIYYQLDDQGHIATRGSFTSTQAIEGTRMLRDVDLVVRGSATPLFEIVYPENRIVVDYGDRRELVALTAIDNRSGVDVPWRMSYSGRWAAEHRDLQDLARLAAEERSNAEGYVVTFESGLRVKIKHAEYVRLHKLITGVNARHIWEILKDGGELDSMVEGVPDELYDWITQTRNGLRDAFQVEEDRCRAHFAGAPGGERKEVAEHFKAGPNPAVLFRMLDGKPWDDLIWKAIKPEPTTPDTIWTRGIEAVA